MSVQIFTMTHKKFDEPGDKIYVPLHVGKAASTDLGYMGDDKGDNISKMNCYYGELTGMYWIWKNYKTSDYVGICHYRRYLINAEEKLMSEQEYTDILKEYDVITTKKLEIHAPYYDGYAENHNIRDLDVTGEVIKEKYPEYYDDFERMVHVNETYFGNIMVTSKELYDEYCQWLFDILFEVQKRVDIESYDDYHKRVFGFISEFLLLVWTQVRKLKVYECKVGMTAEKYETREMKKALAIFFKAKDIKGAKTFFMECIKKRPDVLMEASDITGELKQSMQVITTCENEELNVGNSIINDINDFTELMTFFRDLNQAVDRYRIGKNTLEDMKILENPLLSATAIEISVMLLCIGTKSAADTLLAIAEDMQKQPCHDKAVRLLKRCLDYDSTNEKAIILTNQQ